MPESRPHRGSTEPGPGPEAARRPKWPGVCWAVAAALLVGVWAVLAAGAVDPMSAMALCLLRTAQFTTWPATAFPSTNAPLLVTVVGREPMGGKLDGMFKDDQAGGRRLELKRLGADGDPSGCQVLLIGEVDDDRCRALLRQFSGQPVLTASLRPGFCAMGGMVGLSVEKERVSIEVRRDALQGARLTVDSRLLNLKVVRIYGEAARP